jgi:hypothetical protein
MPITGSKEQPLHSTPVLQTLANFFSQLGPKIRHCELNTVS